MSSAGSQYLVAEIDRHKCASTACRLCTMYCPESNTILYDEKPAYQAEDPAAKFGFAYVDIMRCKGCAICVSICDSMAKKECIAMVAPPVEGAEE